MLLSFETIQTATFPLEPFVVETLSTSAQGETRITLRGAWSARDIKESRSASRAVLDEGLALAAGVTAAASRDSLEASGLRAASFALSVLPAGATEHRQ